MPTSVPASSRPRVSVILPTKDRPDTLPEVLDALERQDLAGLDAELLVVDNGSAPAAVDAARERVARFAWGARFLEESSPGVAAARNTGARVASGAVLVFLNDDVVPADAGWLRGHVDRLLAEDDPRAGVLGPVVWHPGIEITPVMRWLARRGMSHAYGELEAGRSDPAELYANNLSLHRGAFEEAGGFDARFASYGWQEYDFALRLHDRGFRLVLAPELRAWHHHVHDLDDSLRRQERIGRTTVLFNAIHAQRPGLRTPHPGRVKIALGAALAPLLLRLRPPRRLPDRVLAPLLWAMHQAALARGFRAGRRDLPGVL